MDIRIKVRSAGTATAGLIALDGGMDVDTRISAADYDSSQATDSAIRVLSALGVAERGSDGDEAAVGTTSETTQADDAYGLIRTEGGREGIDWAFYVGQVLTTGGGLTIGGVRIEPTPEAFGESEHEAAYPRVDKGNPVARVSNPGDAVRLIWPDGTSRLFIDNGTLWVSPSVVGVFDEVLSVSFEDEEVTVQLVARHPGRGERVFADGQE